MKQNTRANIYFWKNRIKEVSELLSDGLLSEDGEVHYQEKLEEAQEKLEEWEGEL
jgi:hypothetical protein